MEAQDINEEYVDYMHALGKRIKKLRTEMGLSLRDMVVLHGYHESQWRRMEKEGAGLQSLLRISKAFGLTIACILDGVGEPSPTGSVARQEGVNSRIELSKGKESKKR